jgi:8-oxo-dGTP pyrophosphatase MutT (NUDIX family)
MNMLYRLLGYALWPVFFVIFPIRKRSTLLIMVGDEVLAVKHKIYFGSWNLPGGGVKIGEDPLVSVRREVYEELHIRINEDEIRELSTGYDTLREFGITTRQKFFLYSPSEKPVVHKNFEIIDYAWMSKNSSDLGADARYALGLV